MVSMGIILYDLMHECTYTSISWIIVKYNFAHCKYMCITPYKLLTMRGTVTWDHLADEVFINL